MFTDRVELRTARQKLIASGQRIRNQQRQKEGIDPVHVAPPGFSTILPPVARRRKRLCVIVRPSPISDSNLVCACALLVLAACALLVLAACALLVLADCAACRATAMFAASV